MLQKGTGRSVVELVVAVPESVVVVLEVKDAVAKHRRRYETNHRWVVEVNLP